MAINNVYLCSYLRIYIYLYVSMYMRQLVPRHYLRSSSVSNPNLLKLVQYIWIHFELLLLSLAVSGHTVICHYFCIRPKAYVKHCWEKMGMLWSENCSGSCSPNLGCARDQHSELKNEDFHWFLSDPKNWDIILSTTPNLLVGKESNVYYWFVLHLSDVKISGALYQ